ncbi:MAG: tetratricopeptide repeat protein [candidate division WOR-3 bacterium]
MRGIIKVAPLWGAVFFSCFGPNFGAYFNTYYNIDRIVKRIERLESLGDTLLAKPLYDSLETKCAYLIKYYPNSKYLPDAVFYLGLAFSRKGQYEKAIQKFREFLEFFPNHPLSNRAKLELGRVYALDPRYTDLSISVLKDVKSDEAYYWMAYSYYQIGDYNSAQVYFEKLNIKEKPNKAKRYIPLGLDIYIKANKADRAQELLKIYLSLNLLPSEKKLAEEKKGDILFSTNRIKEAIEVYNSLDYPPRGSDDGRLKFKLGKAYMLLGDTSKALENYEICYSSSAYEKWECGYEAAGIYILKGDYDKAARFYDGIYTQGGGEWRSKAFIKKLVLDEWRHLKGKDDPKSTYRKAEIYYFHLNSTDTAMAIWKNLSKSSDKEISIKSALALIYAYSQKGEKDSAENVYRTIRHEVKDTFLINWIRSIIH